MSKTTHILPFHTVNGNKLVWHRFNDMSGGFYADEATPDKAQALIELIPNERTQNRLYAYKIFFELDFNKVCAGGWQKASNRFKKLLDEFKYPPYRVRGHSCNSSDKKFYNKMIPHLCNKRFRSWCRENQPTEF